MSELCNIARRLRTIDILRLYTARFGHEEGTVIDHTIFFMRRASLI